MRFKQLNEDTFEQAVKNAQNIMDNEIIVDVDDEDSGDIEDALNEALQVNLDAIDYGEDEFASVLLIGDAGVGKTQRVKQWCNRHGLNMVKKDVKIMDIGDLRGLFAPNADKTRAINLPTDEFNVLEKQGTVLFLDEFNRTAGNIRFTLSQLINEHTVPDASNPSGVRFFPNLVLVVAAINPADFGVYNTDELDVAEFDRFSPVYVVADKGKLKSYFDKFFSERMEKAAHKGTQDKYQKESGRRELAMAILSNRDFEFDDHEDVKTAAENSQKILSPRGLEDLLKDCDGTKQDFLRKWDKHCNPTKKGTAERILANYQDKDDKANSVFKSDSPFKKSGSDTWKKIQGNLDNM